MEAERQLKMWVVCVEREHPRNTTFAAHPRGGQVIGFERARLDLQGLGRPCLAAFLGQWL